MFDLFLAYVRLNFMKTFNKSNFLAGFNPFLGEFWPSLAYLGQFGLIYSLISLAHSDNFEFVL